MTNPSENTICRTKIFSQFITNMIQTNYDILNNYLNLKKKSEYYI